MPPAQINNHTDDYKKTHSADGVINKAAAPAEPVFPPPLRIYTFAHNRDFACTLSLLESFLSFAPSSSLAIIIYRESKKVSRRKS